MPIYAVISGFQPNDTPGVGTFYDFLHRLWLSENPNLSDHIHLTKAVPKKPPKGEKAEPIDKISVEELIAQYCNIPFSPDQFWVNWKVTPKTERVQ